MVRDQTLTMSIKSPPCVYQNARDGGIVTSDARWQNNTRFIGGDSLMIASRPPRVTDARIARQMCNLGTAGGKTSAPGRNTAVKW